MGFRSSRNDHLSLFCQRGSFLHGDPLPLASGLLHMVHELVRSEGRLVCVAHSYQHSMHEAAAIVLEIWVGGVRRGDELSGWVGGSGAVGCGVGVQLGDLVWAAGGSR